MKYVPFEEEQSSADLILQLLVYRKSLIKTESGHSLCPYLASTVF